MALRLFSSSVSFWSSWVSGEKRQPDWHGDDDRTHVHSLLEFCGAVRTGDGYDGAVDGSASVLESTRGVSTKTLLAPNSVKGGFVDAPLRSAKSRSRFVRVRNMDIVNLCLVVRKSMSVI